MATWRPPSAVNAAETAIPRVRALCSRTVRSPAPSPTVRGGPCARKLLSHTCVRKPTRVRPAQGKLAVLLPGLGAVATTTIAGVLLARRGLGTLFGSVTQLDTIRLGKYDIGIAIGLDKHPKGAFTDAREARLAFFSAAMRRHRLRALMHPIERRQLARLEEHRHLLIDTGLLLPSAAAEQRLVARVP